MLESAASPPQLKRSLGLLSCTLMGIGVILGAGIYALVGKAAGLAGNAVWVSFFAAAVVAALTGLSYAELSSFIPRAGGEYHYARRAFGERIAFLVTWLLLVGLAIASAAVALGFGGYLHALAGVPIIPGALVMIAATAAFLSYGIKESAFLAGLCTVLEIIGLVVVLVIGVPHIGDIDLMEMPRGLDGVMSAAALIFFAYIGFEEIVQLAEETHDPTRTIPRALFLSIAITTALYVVVAVAAISVVGWEKLGASDSPLAMVAETALGSRASAGIAVIALFSTFNTVLVILMSSARLLWGMAEDGALPSRIARVHEKRKTPWVATLIVGAIAAAITVGFKRIEVVANVTNVAIFLTFLIINGAVIVLRFREPDAARPFRIAGSVAKLPIMPVLGIASVLVMLTRSGLTALALGAGIMALGLLVNQIMQRRRTDA